VRRASETPSAGGAVLADLTSALHLVDATGAQTYEPFIRAELGRLNGDEGELREALRLFAEIAATWHARRLGAELAR
jgi:hypothetical protein